MQFLLIRLYAKLEGSESLLTEGFRIAKLRGVCNTPSRGPMVGNYSELEDHLQPNIVSELALHGLLSTSPHRASLFDLGDDTYYVQFVTELSSAPDGIHTTSSLSRN